MALAHSLARSPRIAASATIVVLALLVIPATRGHADPMTEAQARQAAASLQKPMEQAIEDFDTASVLLQQSQARAKTLKAQAAAQQKKVDDYDAAVSEFAASAYRGARMDIVTSLLQSGSPQQFLDQMSTLENLSRTQRAQLSALTAAKRTLDSQKREIQAELAAQRTNEQIQQLRKAQITKTLQHYKALIAKFNPGRAAVTGGFYTGPATGSARIALQTAFAQLGKPYVWGAAGPRSFDCSGLTMFSWRAAGVSLPHSSRMQFSSGRHVARADLQPGDLVFFGSPIHHVGIYIGAGQMIHAPTPGDVVRIGSITSDYVGAVRP